VFEHIVHVSQRRAVVSHSCRLEAPDRAMLCP
jgi:hypothetical protein